MENNVIKLMRDMGIVLETCEIEAEKFADGNKSAGTRLRKYMQIVKEQAQSVRKEVQEQKNSVTA
jgi:hypothetical protein|tara:strand:+ start:355 stop:549 length:195 start_codon:yes stop_codon:yes gene_type:complete